LISPCVSLRLALAIEPVKLRAPFTARNIGAIVPSMVSVALMGER
jgi:hypothetical protein